MIQNNSVSVIMCVYNGEQFLLDQIESIKCQTLQPDEVTIYDDCSDDSSVNILVDFISKNNLESTWKVIKNKTRKGWRLNFYDALSECDSDYIFFCDQDDIWYHDKIEIMTNVMRNNQNILVLNGLIETINSTGHPINVMNWTKDNVYNGNIINMDFGDIIFNWKIRIGCCKIGRAHV